MNKIQIAKLKYQIFGSLMVIPCMLITVPVLHAADTGTLAIPQRPPAPPSQPMPVAAEVKRVQDAYAKIQDIRGSFTQKSYIKDLEDTQEFAGIFYIKKPSQMMWEYAAPRDEKVFIREKETLIYKKSQNQVIKTTFNKDAYSQAPIALLAGLETVDRDFVITPVGSNGLQLVPRQKMGFIQKLVIETTREEMPLKMFTIFDTYGNVIMIELADPAINTGLKDEIFTFTIPPGAEVYDMNQ